MPLFGRKENKQNSSNRFHVDDKTAMRLFSEIRLQGDVGRNAAEEIVCKMGLAAIPALLQNILREPLRELNSDAAANAQANAIYALVVYANKPVDFFQPVGNFRDFMAIIRSSASKTLIEALKGYYDDSVRLGACIILGHLQWKEAVPALSELKDK